MNKKVLIVFLMLSVFAVGTMTFAEPVEAAKWKKFDSGIMETKGADSSYNKFGSYETYIKGTKQIKMNVYWYKKNDNKKEYRGTVYITKSGQKIKLSTIDYKGKKTKPITGRYNGSVKQYYKTLMKELKK